MKADKLFDQLFNEVADNEMGLAKVITSIRNKMVNKDKDGKFVGKYAMLAELYADAMGESRTEERTNFTERVIFNLPHYTLNGSNRMEACDYVACPDDDAEHRQIREYRFGKGSKLEEIVTLDVCVDSISIEQEVNVMEKVTFASGYVKEMPALDKDGKNITEKQTLKFIPRKKTQWGYTPLVKDAIKAALVELVGE